MTQTAVTSMRFACRRRTAASWTSTNEVLLNGEIGLETDTNKFKFGDGTTAWNSLLYAGGGASGSAAWGDITGTLADQLDLQAALDLKVPTARTVNGHALSANVTLSAADVGADASGAAATAQAYAIQRANHTGTQAQSTITNLVSDLALKADLVGGVIPTAQLPAIAITEYLGSVANQSAMLALSGQKGDWCIRSDLSMVYIITGNDPTQLSDWTGMAYPTAPVLSVNGQTGAVTLAKGDIGLGNVENTALSTWAGSTALTTLGTIATGVWQGTAVGVSYGGTGATSQSGARTNLGLVIGTDVQAYDSDLAAIAALTPSNDDIIQRKAGAWTNRTIAQLVADLGVPTMAGTNTWTAQNTFAAGTITTSQPFTISQTWNAGAVPFTSFLVNVTNSASASTSKLADFQAGGTSQIHILSDGRLRLVQQGSTSAPAIAWDIGGNVGYGFSYGSGEVRVSINTLQVAAFNGSGIICAGVVGNASSPGAMYGYKRQRFDLASSTTLSSGSYNGATITNSTAGAGITSTLVTAAAGWNHRFIDDNASHRWTIKPNTGDVILWPDGTVVTNATGSIVTTARYDAFDVEALDATTWRAYNVRGTPTVTA